MESTEGRGDKTIEARGEGTRRGLPLVLVAALWALAVAVVVAGALSDRGSRSIGPEATVVAYANAVEMEDLDTALAQLVPDVRESSTSWVAWQMGNHYHILESNVRIASLASRLLGGTSPDTATVVVEMEIEGKGNPLWRTVAEIPATLVNGKWLLAKPPLEGL